MYITTLINNIRDALTSSSAINSWCRANYSQAHNVYKGLDEQEPPASTDYPIVHVFPITKTAGEDQTEILHGIGVVVGIIDKTKTASTIEINDSLVNATYKWTASGNGTDEFYCELSGGGDPSLNEPDGVEENTVAMTEGTLGSLAAGQYDYGDNDTLGYSTVYVRLADGADPDSKAAAYVQTADLVPLTEYAGVDNLEAFRKLVETAITGATLGTNLTISSLEVEYETIEHFPAFVAGMEFMMDIPQYQGDDSFA